MMRSNWNRLGICVAGLGIAASAFAADTAQPAAGELRPVAEKPARLAAPTASPVETPEWAPRARRFGGFEWVTRPSRDAVMGFTIPMEVGQVLVEGGQQVKTGQLLIVGREAEPVASLNVQKVRAANEGPIKSAQATVELAQIRFDAAKKAMKEEGFTQSEFDDRRVALDSARAALVNAQAQTDEEKERVKQLEEQVERYRLRARFDGVVELIATDLGQAVDIQQPVIRVVSIDPLWIDAPVPTEETFRLKLASGAPAWVLLDVPDTWSGPSGGAMQGKVLYVSPVVDAAGSRRVRVEVPNKALLPAGTKARVRFTPPTDSSSAPTGGSDAR